MEGSNVNLEGEHRLSESSDEDANNAEQPNTKAKKKPTANTENKDDGPSNADILKLLIQQNQTLLKIVEKG